VRRRPETTSVYRLGSTLEADDRVADIIEFLTGRATIGVVGVAIGVSLIAWGRDRFPRFTGIVDLAGLAVLVASVGWLVITAPLASIPIVFLFFLWNLMISWSGASTEWKATPADERAALVWIEETNLLHSLGWDYLGTWILDLGQVRPALTALVRPHDGTRVGMMGTSATAGVVSVETLLDDGRGLMVTLRKKSSQLRPAWMFRQELEGELQELIRAHDEAVFLLQTKGVRPTPYFPGWMLAYEFYTNAKYRTDVRRRWWLYAVRPIARRMSASRRRPLTEQTDLDQQIERYVRAIEDEPPLTGSVSSHEG
jgi:hypothetical protein